MYRNHLSLGFIKNHWWGFHHQPEMYHTTVKVCCIGLNRAFYRPFSEKVLKKHCFARVLHAICMWIDLQFFWRIHEHNWGRLDSKPSKSVTPRCNAKYILYILNTRQKDWNHNEFAIFKVKQIQFKLKID